MEVETFGTAGMVEQRWVGLMTKSDKITGKGDRAIAQGEPLRDQGQPQGVGMVVRLRRQLSKQQGLGSRHRRHKTSTLCWH